MHPQLNALLISDALFSTDLERLDVLRLIAMNGERFRLRDPNDIQRFFAAVSQRTDEVRS